MANRKDPMAMYESGELLSSSSRRSSIINRISSASAAAAGSAADTGKELFSNTLGNNAPELVQSHKDAATLMLGGPIGSMFAKSIAKQTSQTLTNALNRFKGSYKDNYMEASMDSGGDGGNTYSSQQPTQPQPVVEPNEIDEVFKNDDGSTTKRKTKIRQSGKKKRIDYKETISNKRQDNTLASKRGTSSNALKSDGFSSLDKNYVNSIINKKFDEKSELPGESLTRKDLAFITHLSKSIVSKMERSSETKEKDSILKGFGEVIIAAFPSIRMMNASKYYHQLPNPAKVGVFNAMNTSIGMLYASSRSIGTETHRLLYSLIQVNKIGMGVKLKVKAPTDVTTLTEFLGETLKGAVKSPFKVGRWALTGALGLGGVGQGGHGGGGMVASNNKGGRQLRSGKGLGLTLASLLGLGSIGGLGAGVYGKGPLAGVVGDFISPQHLTLMQKLMTGAGGMGLAGLKGLGGALASGASAAGIPLMPLGMGIAGYAGYRALGGAARSLRTGALKNTKLGKMYQNSTIGRIHGAASKVKNFIFTKGKDEKEGEIQDPNNNSLYSKEILNAMRIDSARDKDFQTTNIFLLAKLAKIANKEYNVTLKSAEEDKKANKATDRWRLFQLFSSMAGGLLGMAGGMSGILDSAMIVSTVAVIGKAVFDWFSGKDGLESLKKTGMDAAIGTFLGGGLGYFLLGKDGAKIGAEFGALLGAGVGSGLFKYFGIEDKVKDAAKGSVIGSVIGGGIGMWLGGPAGGLIGAKIGSAIGAALLSYLGTDNISEWWAGGKGSLGTKDFGKNDDFTDGKHYGSLYGESFKSDTKDFTNYPVMHPKYGSNITYKPYPNVIDAMVEGTTVMDGISEKKIGYSAYNQYINPSIIKEQISNRAGNNFNISNPAQMKIDELIKKAKLNPGPKNPYTSDVIKRQLDAIFATDSSNITDEQRNIVYNKVLSEVGLIPPNSLDFSSTTKTPEIKAGTTSGLTGNGGLDLILSSINKGALPDQTTMAPSSEFNTNGFFQKVPDKYKGFVLASSKKYGVDPNLIAVMMQTESNFNPHADSTSGAMGLMQLLPGTANEMGLYSDYYNPEKNIDAGTRYIAKKLKETNGDVPLALASYNAGFGNVLKYGMKIPPFEETQDYVKKIMGKLGGNYTPGTMSPTSSGNSSDTGFSMLDMPQGSSSSLWESGAALASSLYNNPTTYPSGEVSTFLTDLGAQAKAYGSSALDFIDSRIPSIPDSKSKPIASKSWRRQHSLAFWNIQDQASSSPLNKSDMRRKIEEYATKNPELKEKIERETGLTIEQLLDSEMDGKELSSLITGNQLSGTLKNISDVNGSNGSMGDPGFNKFAASVNNLISTLSTNNSNSNVSNGGGNVLQDFETDRLPFDLQSLLFGDFD